MLLIRNQIDHQSSWSAERHRQFLQACQTYIGRIKKEGKLISAQPLVREGRMISGTAGKFSEQNFTQNNEVIAGYYHIIANDIEDAISIAKQNPEFEFSTTAKIEVRPIKMNEEKTGFVYPSA